MNRQKPVLAILLLAVLHTILWADTASVPDSTQKEKPRYFFSPIVVTATKIPQSTRDLSMSVDVIPASEVRLEMAHNVGQLVDEVPGVSAIQFGTLGSVSQHGAAGSKNLSGSKILIRGTNVVTMIDGRPTMMGIFDHPIGNALNPFLGERIEIVRGPASVLYGSNATGGVINFLTPGVLGKTQMRFRLSGGTFQTRVYNLGGIWGTKRVGVGIFWNGYDTNSNRLNGGYHAHDFFAKTVFKVLPNWDIQISSKRYRGTWFDPGTIFSPLKNNWFDFTRRGADLQIRGKTRLGITQLMLYRTDGHHAIYNGYRSDDWTNGAKLSQIFHPCAGNETVVGMDFRQYGGTDLNSGKSWRVSEWAPYFLTQQFFRKKWIASLGYRFNHHQIYGFASVPSLGLVFQATPSLALRTNVSRGFRSPSVMQLYLYPPSNANLKPEETTSQEIGLNYTLPWLSLDLVGYNLKGQNLIQFYFPDKKFRNVGSFHFRGIELALRAQVTSFLTDRLAFTHQDVGAATAYNPQHRLINGLHFHYGKAHALFRTTWVHNLYGENNYQKKLRDFLVTDTYVTLSLNRLVTLQLAARNLTDEKYEMEFGYPMPGRNFEAGLLITY